MAEPVRLIGETDEDFAKRLNEYRLPLYRADAA